MADPDRPGRYSGPATHGPLDEDAVPAAAAVLAAVTNPVPVGAAERLPAHLGRVGWRASVLALLVLLAYLPGLLLSPNLLDGEGDAYAHQPMPALPWTVAAAAAAKRPPTGVGTSGARPSPLLWVAVHAEGLVGNGPLSHHAAGLLVHGLAAVALWAVLRRLLRPGAWLAAAAFGLNPGASAAVEWMGLRGRPWGGLLAAVGCWLLLRACAVPPPVRLDAADYDPDEDPRGVRWLLAAAVGPLTFVAAGVALVAATLCQPTAAVVGLVAVLLVAWRRGLRPLDAAWAVPAAVLAVAGLTTAALAATPAGRDPAVANLSAALQPLWWTGQAIERIAWPLASADLATAGPASRVLTACGVGAAFWAAALAAVVGRRWIGVGPAVAAGCFALLLPTMVVPPALRPVPGLTPAEQAGAAATYLLVIPVLVVLADAVVVACRRLVRADLLQRLAEVGAAATALAVLGSVAAVRAGAFADTETVLKTAVRVNHRSWADRSRLASWYLGQHRPDAALEVMSGLTRDNCPDADTAVVEGDLVRADGDLTGGMAWYARAAELAPDAVDPVGRRSSLYLQMGRVGDAIDTYERAVERHPGSAVLRDDFGNLLVSQNDLPLAEEQFRRSIAADPDVAGVHVNLATALLGQGKVAEGAAELQEAVRLDPENYEAFHNAGIVLHAMRDFPRAARMLNEAVRLRPDSPEARMDLGVALSDLAQTDPAKYRGAEFELKEAVRLRPDYADAKRNLSIVQQRMAAQRQRANVQGK